MGTTGWWTRWIGLLSRRAGRGTLTAVLVAVALATGGLLEASSADRLGTLQLLDPLLDEGLQLIAWCVYGILRRSRAFARHRDSADSEERASRVDRASSTPPPGATEAPEPPARGIARPTPPAPRG